MSVKLPVLGAKSAPIAQPERGVAVERVVERVLAGRPLLSVLGADGLDLPLRFGCMLAREHARAGHALTVVLGPRAPGASERALSDAGARIERVASESSEALSAALQQQTAGLCVLIERQTAACLRGWLDVWVGPAPAPGGDGLAHALFRASDLVVSPSSLGAAVPLAAGLLERLQ